MLRKILRKMTLAMAASLLAINMLAPTAVFAQSAADVCAGVGVATGDTSCGDGGLPVDNVIQVALQIFAAVIGVVAVVMIMIAGFKYVTSGGDASSISSAKQTITYALVGLIIAFLAQGIVTFVLGEVNDPAGAAAPTQPAE